MQRLSFHSEISQAFLASSKAFAPLRTPSFGHVAYSQAKPLKPLYFSGPERMAASKSVTALSAFPILA